MCDPICALCPQFADSQVRYNIPLQIIVKNNNSHINDHINNHVNTIVIKNDNKVVNNIKVLTNLLSN